ncbi:MAG: ATP-binding protein [Cyanobacteria bacterium P01_C01_bin.120]
MLNKVVAVKNVERLTAAHNALKGASYHLPKIGLIHGLAGAGKTTAIAHLSQVHGGCFVRATAVWTPKAMLVAILRELGRDEIRGNNQAKLDEVIERLAIAQLPLFVDEADYLFQRPATLDILRDIHDQAGVPLYLVGMERISRKVNNRELVASRVSQEVKFAPLDLEDTRLVADSLSEIRLEDDLLEDLHQRARGSIRRITVGLSVIETYGKHTMADSLTLAQWQQSGHSYFLER